MTETKDIKFDMLSVLMKKKAAVLKTQEETRSDMSPAIDDVNRQIAQVLRGEKATKSDGSFGID